jgi:hypothetical protein
LKNIEEIYEDNRGLAKEVEKVVVEAVDKILILLDDSKTHEDCKCNGDSHEGKCCERGQLSKTCKTDSNAKEKEKLARTLQELYRALDRTKTALNKLINQIDPASNIKDLVDVQWRLLSEIFSLQEDKYPMDQVL